MMLMLNVLTAENKEELLAFAGDNSKPAVEEKVKEMRSSSVAAGEGDSSGSPRGIRHSFPFALYNDRGETAKAIIEQKKTELGKEATDSDAFYAILVEWAQQHQAAEAVSEAPAA